MCHPHQIKLISIIIKMYYRKSPFYNKILGCCDFATFCKVKDNTAQSSGPSASTSTGSPCLSESAAVDDDIASEDTPPDTGLKINSRQGRFKTDQGD